MLDAASRLRTERLNEPGTIPGGLGTGSVHEMLAHIVWAEEVWLRRWQGEERVPLPAGGDFPDLGAIAERWEEVERGRSGYLDGLSDDDLGRGVREGCIYSDRQLDQRVSSRLVTAARNTRTSSEDLSTSRGFRDTAPSRLTMRIALRSPRTGDGSTSHPDEHGVLCGLTMFTKQVSRPLDSPDPYRGRGGEQVERTRRKTWSRGRSEVFVPYRLHRPPRYGTRHRAEANQTFAPGSGSPPAPTVPRRPNRARAAARRTVKSGARVGDARFVTDKVPRALPSWYEHEPWIPPDFELPVRALDHVPTAVPETRDSWEVVAEVRRRIIDQTAAIEVEPPWVSEGTGLHLRDDHLHHATRASRCTSSGELRDDGVLRLARLLLLDADVKPVLPKRATRCIDPLADHVGNERERVDHDELNH
jgi:hypothetical protein